jgi:hypothetical protein
MNAHVRCACDIAWRMRTLVLNLQLMDVRNLVLTLSRNGFDITFSEVELDEFRCSCRPDPTPLGLYTDNEAACKLLDNRVAAASGGGCGAGAARGSDGQRRVLMLGAVGHDRQ